MHNAFIWKKHFYYPEIRQFSLKSCRNTRLHNFFPPDKTHSRIALSCAVTFLCLRLCATLSRFRRRKKKLVPYISFSGALQPRVAELFRSRRITAADASLMRMMLLLIFISSRKGSGVSKIHRFLYQVSIFRGLRTTVLSAVH